MSKQQYRTIADRAKGDDPNWPDIEPGDRYVAIARDLETRSDDDQVIRIERQVPTTDKPFCDSCRGPYDDAWLAMYGRHWDTCPNRVIATASSSHPPTREQIAEVIATTPLPSGGTLLASSVQVEVVADAVLALLNGADR